MLIHQAPKALCFIGDVHLHFRDENRRDVIGLARETDLWNPFLPIEKFAVFKRRRGRQPAAVAAHDFVDDQHSGVGSGFGNDVAEIARALFGCGPGPERLSDRKHIVVYGLG